MKITKRSVATSAFNVFLVLGLVILESAPVDVSGSETVFWIMRIGLPITLGVVGAFFVYRLLGWYEQTRVHGKADSED